MPAVEPISDPDQPSFGPLCQRLAELARAYDDHDEWPRDAMQLCADYGVYRWFLPAEWGGYGWSEADVLRGYLRLSAACLTVSFILTQRTAASSRILASDNALTKQRWLPRLATGEVFATVGISHLTTSRRHLARPVLEAREASGGFVLNGYSPWVTGAVAADVMVLGATLPDDRQILLAVPTELPGIVIGQPSRLVGLSASSTGEVRLNEVMVPVDCLLAGPEADVMRASGTGTGGLQTSTLAIGQANAAIEFLETEAAKRTDLLRAAKELRREHAALEANLLALAGGTAACSSEELRAQANSIVLRATQAALAAAKGTGYVVGHPAGRWCREALFFLVWSCPQPVMAANLCELAGIEG